MKNIFLVNLLMIFGALNISAQYTLTGKVTAEATGIPLYSVSIHDKQSNKTVETDVDGNFVFDNMTIGEHHIVLFSIEHKTMIDTIFVDKNINKSYAMADLVYELDDVAIKARKVELFGIKQLEDIEETSIYAGKKSEVVVMDKVKGNLAINNSRQVYAQVSGLNIYEGSEGGIQVNIGGRGLDPNRTSNFNTRQNGYDISADVLGYPENYYTPPADAISEIRILRGASSLQYGTQFGGLIDFRLRRVPLFKKVGVLTKQSIGSFGFFNTFNAIGINKGKVSLNTFYNFKRGDGYRPNSKFDVHNFFIAGDYRLNKRTTITGEFTYFHYLAKQAGGLTDYQFDENPRQSTRERNWFRIDWKLYNLKVNHSFRNDDQLSINLFGLNARREAIGFRGNPKRLNENPITALDEQRADGEYVNPRDLTAGHFKNYGAEVRYLKKYKSFNKKSILLLGSKYYNASNSAIQGPGSRKADADFGLYNDEFPDYPNQSNMEFPNLNVAFFSENVFYLSKRLSITPGIRFDYIKTRSNGNYKNIVYDLAGNPILSEELEDNRTLDRNILLLGVGLSYKVSPAMQLIANVSQNYRSITFNDIRVVSPTFIVDPNINDEKGFTADVGIKGRLKHVLSYDVTLFSVLYDDRIGVILDDRANRVRKNIGTAWIGGVESLVSANILRRGYKDNDKINLSCYLNTAYTYSRYVSSEENNVVGKKVEFIPTINLKTGISASYDRLGISFQYAFLSKQFTDAQNSAIATFGEARSGIIGEIPQYAVADLTFSYQLKKLRFDAGLNNLFNRAYFTRRATGYPGPGIIPSDGRSFFFTASLEI